MFSLNHIGPPGPFIPTDFSPFKLKKINLNCHVRSKQRHIGVPCFKAQWQQPLKYFIFLKNIELTEWLLGKHIRENKVGIVLKADCFFPSPILIQELIQEYMIPLQGSEKTRKKIVDAFLRPN